MEVYGRGTQASLRLRLTGEAVTPEAWHCAGDGEAGAWAHTFMTRASALGPSSAEICPCHGFKWPRGGLGPSVCRGFSVSTACCLS